MSAATTADPSTRVFLGHSHRDKALADEIRHALVACGLEVWFDEVEIRPGASLAASISSGLEEADVVVMLLSKSSFESQWASLEIGGALVHRKPLIPVLIERGAELPFMLRDRKFIDASDSSTRDQAVKQLCYAVRDRTEVSSTELRAATKQLELASDALEQERAAFDRRVARDRRLFAIRLALGWASLFATVVVFGTILLTGSNVLTALAAGAATVAASRVGVLYGAERWRSRERVE